MKRVFTAILIFSSFIVFAQKGSVKGFVYDKANGEGIPFGTVKVDGTEFGTSTDDHGFFGIPNLPAGSYNLIISYVGYETQTVPVEIKKNQTANVKVYLEVKSVELQGVEISGEKQQQKTETRVSVTTVTPAEINSMPSVGGEADIAQYLPVLPGIVSTGDQGGQIIIRGATEVQTQYLLDGIQIYNPIHSIGLFSVYETDVIKNVDVYTGGFPSQYGTRTGAVVDVNTRDGNQKDFSGKVSVSPFMAHALLEIPVIKLKEDRNTSASLILSSKVSYLDESAKVFYPYAGSNGLPYSFYDLFGKFTVNTSYGNKFSITGFDYNDNTDFSAANYNWNTFGAGANFLAVPKNSNLYFNTHASYSQYSISLNEADNLPSSSMISDFNVGMDFSYYLNQGDLKYGLAVEGTKTNFAFTNTFEQNIDQNQNSTDLNAYFTFHKYVKKFVIEAGLRFQYYGVIGAASPEPRLSMKYNATNWFRIKMASGLYSQNIISATNNQEVVDLFTGFLTGTNETALHSTANAHNMQRSVDAILGFEFDLPKHIFINIEPYYKYFWHILDINEYKEFNDDPDFMLETGKAYGVDFLIKWEWRRVSLYGTYSLAWVSRNDSVQIYPPYYDRRHNINFVATYKFGKKQDWEASVRWNFGSGFPFTQTQSFYEYNPFTNGIGTNVTGTNGNLGVVYTSQIDGGRLPAYSRVDLEIKKAFPFKPRMKLELTAGVSNVLDRENIFYFDPITYTRVNQLPILPSVTVSFAW